MKSFYPLLALLAFFATSEAFGCSSGGCGGCLLTNIQSKSKDPTGTWMKFYTQLKSSGVRPISCYRSYQCSVNIARTCGRGRAAKPGRSNHQVAVAMDFRTGDAGKAKSIAGKILRGNVRQLMHGGGGFHMSNGANEGKAFRASSPVVRAYRQKNADRSRR